MQNFAQNFDLLFCVVTQAVADLTTFSKNVGYISRSCLFSFEVYLIT